LSVGLRRQHHNAGGEHERYHQYSGHVCMRLLLNNQVARSRRGPLVDHLGVRAPTGMACFAAGWTKLRQSPMGSGIAWKPVVPLNCQRAPARGGRMVATNRGRPSSVAWPSQSLPGRFRRQELERVLQGGLHPTGKSDFRASQLRCGRRRFDCGGVGFDGKWEPLWFVSHRTTLRPGCWSKRRVPLAQN
jgi:hypothetical protein